QRARCRPCARDRPAGRRGDAHPARQDCARPSLQRLPPRLDHHRLAGGHGSRRAVAAGLRYPDQGRQDLCLGHRPRCADGLDARRDPRRPAGRSGRGDGRAGAGDARRRRRRPQPGRRPTGQARTAGKSVKRFNLSDWALEHRSLVWYFMIVFALAGAFSYLGLGREEDPNFTIKTMVIQAMWPGASAEEVAKQVTDRIEKKLDELESLDYTKSVTTPGKAIVFVNLLPTTKAKDVPH